VSLRLILFVLLGLFSLSAHAQLDYSAYGTLDLSYGRFEPSGFVHEDRFNSNSLSASFVGVNAKYGLDGGWTPGITLETFIRFQDLTYGRNDSDPFFSRNNFVSLANPDYGLLRVGRLQTYLFETTVKFNAFGNSTGFSPALRQIFLSGNLESVEGDFYWDQALSYSTPRIEGVGLQANAMYALSHGSKRGDYAGGSVIFSRGLFAASLAGQRVYINNGIDDPTDQTTWQLGTSYNLGFASLFGQYTNIRNDFLSVHSNLYTTGASVPIGPGTVMAQIAYSTSTGPAVDRRHTTTSIGYAYSFDSVTDIYVIGGDDRIKNQTRGVSYAVGLRYLFSI
jgi:predicted porin